MARSLLPLILALLFGAAPAGATTIQITTGVLDPLVGTGATDCSFATGGPTANCLSDETSAVAPSAGARGIAKAFADITTGELKAQVTGTTASGAAATVAQQEVLSVDSTVSIFETLTVSGDGTLSASLAYDGSWSVFDAGSPFLSRFLYSPTLVLNGDSGFSAGNPFAGTQTGAPTTGAVSSQIDLQIPVQDGDSVTISSTIQLQLVNMQGDVDFFSTGSLRLAPSSGVSLTFSNPDFLSEVPEPAAAALLALGFFTLVRRRR